MATPEYHSSILPENPTVRGAWRLLSAGRKASDSYATAWGVCSSFVVTSRPRPSPPQGLSDFLHS